MSDNVFILRKTSFPGRRLMLYSTFWTIYLIVADQRFQAFLTQGVAAGKYPRCLIPIQLILFKTHWTLCQISQFIHDSYYLIVPYICQVVIPEMILTIFFLEYRALCGATVVPCDDGKIFLRTLCEFSHTGISCFRGAFCWKFC